jgi:hypothetical protein
MKRFVSVLILGLTVLLGTSFTEAYNRLPETRLTSGANAAEHAELDRIFMNPVDFPAQQGDIRVFKEVTQKVRSGQDDVISFVALTKGFFELNLVAKSHHIYQDNTRPAVIHSKHPRCIQFRSLLI